MSQTAAKTAMKRASLLPFVFVMYSYTTGGPFGLEGQVTTSGPGMTLIYHLLLPFFWCIPVSFVSAELTTAMPVEGGFYRWSRAAFGDFWGFLAGWWNWCASFILGGVYAVMFADYMQFYFPQLKAPLAHFAVALAMIIVITFVNIVGIDAVGKVATVFGVLILAPIAVMCVWGATKWQHNPFLPLIPPGATPKQVAGVGLALGLWLYSGFEQLSTVAEEVEDPQRTFPRALAWAVPMAMATYFLPTLFSLAAVGDWHAWKDGYFSTAAFAIGGHWLGFAVNLAALITAVSLLNGTVIASTRMPFAMAEDGYLPRFLAKTHARFKTPWLAIICSACVYAALSWKSLSALIIVYSWLRVATTWMTVIAAWRLRAKDPNMKRPFRIPWGIAGVAYCVIAPLIIGAIALSASENPIGGLLSLALGPLMYPVVKFFARRAARADQAAAAIS
ncbi:amino acid/polyamine/organocation transporter, APC superfamily [Candidatus Koribacter versatilis Ellin345]|uniref:Amino acid/polyamine/organocation transporter, APC superfamily n=1 Tax=Koribacter versatilis (strain Ellin345) TaxID=204669 RepID=Q1ILY5_KORVE|nr:APC family permease [Candidatus Koribacter versatilis]ABF42115.1 amino acid/polyamine/organocation transporter, APC superfamily [Candidatus Koribacter versatilis Ellin345]